MDLATPDFLGGGVRGVVDGVAQEIEPFLGVLVGVWAEWVVVDGCWGTGNLAIVGGGVEVDDVEGGLEEVDAGNEGFALDAVLVEVVGVAVGGGDEEDAVGHEGFEESVELFVRSGCSVGEAGLVNYLRRIIASATSVHWNSSKHSTLEPSAMEAATRGSASKSLPYFILTTCMRLCTSCMKLWKWMRVLVLMLGGRVS